jgi:hypothetical protein
MRDDFDLDELTAWGCPWHGIVSGGNLTTTVGGVIREWAQPDSGDCWLVKAHDIPEVTRTPEQLELDAAAGAEWRDYALLTGWYQRQLYGKPLSSGSTANKRIIYLPEAGHGWSAFLNLTAGNTVLTGSIVLSRLKLGSTEQQTISGLSLSLSWPASNGEYWDVVAVSENGSKIVLGLWSDGNGASSGSGLRYVYSKSSPHYRARVYINGDSSAAFWDDFYNRLVAPQQYALIELSGGTSIEEEISANLTLLKSISEVAPAGIITSTPAPLKYIYQVSDRYEMRDSIGGSGLLISTVAEGDGGNEYETEAIVGVYFEEGAIKWVTVHETMTESISYSTLLPEPEIIGIAPNFFRYAEFELSGQISLEMDGVPVSVIEFSGTESLEAEFDSNNHLVLDVGNVSGEVSIDGIPIYSASDTGPLWLNSPVRQDASPNLGNDARVNVARILSVHVHGLMYSAGAYGLVVEVVTRTIALEGFPEVDQVLYSGGVVSVVTKERESPIGSITIGSTGWRYIYENYKVSHHPVSGDILMNAGAWV